MPHLIWDLEIVSYGNHVYTLKNIARTDKEVTRLEVSTVDGEMSTRVMTDFIV